MRTIPRLKFAHLPTPVEMLPRLSAALGGPKLLVKRDDLTGVALGGNKIRKLEFLVADAQATGAHTLITAGAVQSNHCRQTAAVAARFDFDCILVLSGEKPTTATGNLMLDQLFGAEFIWTSLKDRDLVLRQTFEQAWEQGRRPYLIPYGGSNTIGATAYAFAIQELIDQQCEPDWIVFASSSGGTQAGLVIGANLFNFHGKILGISVDQSKADLQTRIATLATKTADMLGETFNFQPQDILVSADYLGDGYGIMGKPEIEAIKLFAREEGLLLDPIYTGRSGAGLIDLIRKGFFKPDETVLFWHTGGTPAIFSENYQRLSA